MNSDTICAISTPAGIGGIAVLRLSGPEAQPLAQRFLFTPAGRPMQLCDRRAIFAQLHLDDGSYLDEVVATYFAAPHSYSGDDTVEISCHGSLFIQQRALQLFVDHGARLAEPGEFTQRAFLNGRLDLSQAEAVADLIDARSQAAHRLAVSQMRGGYARELAALRQQLIDLSALLELELDFTEEDLEFVDRQQFRQLLTALQERMRRLLDSFQMGNAIKQGIPVAIIGRPNAGKSSLLNALLADERAIVSPIAGTTRDTIEEPLLVDGLLFRIIDTAGLRHSDDQIETMGLKRALKMVETAHIVILVHDASCVGQIAPLDEFGSLLDASLFKDKSLITVYNKCDLASAPEASGIAVSALTGMGIEDLKQALAQTARSRIPDGDGLLLCNLRHYEALRQVVASLDEVRQGLDSGLTPDLLAVDIRNALYHLGTITGEVASDEVLASVFSRFCIGK